MDDKYSERVKYFELDKSHGFKVFRFDFKLVNGYFASTNSTVAISLKFLKKKKKAWKLEGNNEDLKTILEGTR